MAHCKCIKCKEKTDHHHNETHHKINIDSIQTCQMNDDHCRFNESSHEFNKCHTMFHNCSKRYFKSSKSSFSKTKFNKWCSTFLTLIVSIFFTIASVQGFNIHTDDFVMHRGQKGSMFGFSVAQHKDGDGNW